MHKMLVEVSTDLILHGKKCKTDAAINTCVPWITKTERVCVEVKTRVCQSQHIMKHKVAAPNPKQAKVERALVGSHERVGFSKKEKEESKKQWLNSIGFLLKLILFMFKEDNISDLCFLL